MATKKTKGRPTKYKAEYVEQVYKLCLLGATDEELADFFEVDERTINRWKIDYPDFCQSIKKGKLIADGEVAQSLYKRANGYEYKEIKSAPNRKEKLGIKEITVKHIPPDTGAAFIWLKNRQSKKWRDKQEINIDGRVESALSPLSDIFGKKNE